MVKKLETQDLKVMMLFERVTKAQAMDCLQTKNSLTMIVKPGDMGFAIGKGGANIKKFQNLVKKKVQVIEYDEDPAKFVKNIIAPMKAEVEVGEDTITIKAPDYQSRGKIIGRGKNVLNKIHTLLERHNLSHKVEVK
jgi:N utilization substance protein A